MSLLSWAARYGVSNATSGRNWTMHPHNTLYSSMVSCCACHAHTLPQKMVKLIVLFVPSIMSFVHHFSMLRCQHTTGSRAFTLPHTCSTLLIWVNESSGIILSFIHFISDFHIAVIIFSQIEWKQLRFFMKRKNKLFTNISVFHHTEDPWYFFRLAIFMCVPSHGTTCSSISIFLILENII
jgi:hypothetical protein